MKSRLTRALTLAALAGAACAAPGQESDSGTLAGLSAADEQSIRDVLGDFDMAFSDEDLQAVLGHYSSDVVHLPPDEPAVIGLTAVRARDSIYVANNDVQLNSVVEEIDGVGDHAFARYTYTESWTPLAGGDATTVNGKGVALLRRAPDGSWELTHWVWNHNEPNQ